MIVDSLANEVLRVDDDDDDEEVEVEDVVLLLLLLVVLVPFSVGVMPMRIFRSSTIVSPHSSPQSSGSRATASACSASVRGKYSGISCLYTE